MSCNTFNENRSVSILLAQQITSKSNLKRFDKPAPGVYFQKTPPPDVVRACVCVQACDSHLVYDASVSEKLSCRPDRHRFIDVLERSKCAAHLKIDDATAL